MLTIDVYLAYPLEGYHKKHVHLWMLIKNDNQMQITHMSIYQTCNQMSCFTKWFDSILATRWEKLQYNKCLIACAKKLRMEVLSNKCEFKTR